MPIDLYVVFCGSGCTGDGDVREVSLGSLVRPKPDIRVAVCFIRFNLSCSFEAYTICCVNSFHEQSQWRLSGERKSFGV